MVTASGIHSRCIRAVLASGSAHFLYAVPISDPITNPVTMPATTSAAPRQPPGQGMSWPRVRRQRPSSMVSQLVRPIDSE